MTTPDLTAMVEAASAAISARATVQPRIGLVLGSGLGEIAEQLSEQVRIPYGDIPHWPTSTVQGHGGRLVLGRMEGIPVLVQQGRAHFYEGYSPAEITFPIRVMKKLGIEILVVTNAAGGINSAFRAGDLMLIRDHINLPGISGFNPLRGPNDDKLGPRFPDMTHPYDSQLAQLARGQAAELGLDLQEGVYACVAGPSFETPAEIRYLASIGADAVGMSTAPAVVVACHSGMRVLGFSSITNVANAAPDEDAKTTHAEVLEVGLQAAPRLARLLKAIIPSL